MADRMREWREAAVSHVRFRPDRPAIDRELEDHMEDCLLDLRRLGYPADEAEERVLKAMGDPAETGRALDREHAPLLGWLWVASRWLVRIAVVLLVAEVFLLGCSVFQYREVLSSQWPREAAAEFPELFPEADRPAGWTYLGGGASDSSIRADCYTLSVSQWSQWEWPNGYAQVYLVLTVEPDQVWQGADDTEFADDLRFRCGAGEITNARSRSRIYRGGTPVPWAAASHGGLRQGLTKECYRVEMALTEPVEWVELYYPYGDNDWVLRVEVEETP
ncbi:permease prefix domain 1-containing protein [Dysosmobacter sp.]|uniref:permease prefix domain 1-containing protein n=1 Tax=Dysosmobacter sp. TaxID=2591382 RepID=UPI002A8811B3|nr:permease prefix domain 1-containing protein [Dysosmobacter sp.]MDY3282892.1 permease prefix domain 1-containing protein [Dysosmobacter sp.]